MIEKLIQKNKKLKDGKMKKDFPGIFNLNRNEDESQPTESEADLKTYRKHMSELYELLLK